MSTQLIVITQSIVGFYFRVTVLSTCSMFAIHESIIPQSDIKSMYGFRYYIKYSLSSNGHLSTKSLISVKCLF